MSLMVTALALMLCKGAFSCSKGIVGQQETDL